MEQQSDGQASTLQTSALRQALDRLQMLGLIHGETTGSSAILGRLIAEAFGRGERNQENLILYAIGRFQAQPPCDDTP